MTSSSVPAQANKDQRQAHNMVLDERVVQTIVQKLGYSEEEVRNYVAKDKNSFVGVLYNKLVEDQTERRLIVEKQVNQTMLQRQM